MSGPGPSSGAAPLGGIVSELLWVDPTDLKVGDLVLGLRERDLDGCHCDVMVFVMRPIDEEESA